MRSEQIVHEVVDIFSSSGQRRLRRHQPNQLATKSSLKLESSLTADLELSPLPIPALADNIAIRSSLAFFISANFRFFSSSSCRRRSMEDILGRRVSDQVYDNRPAFAFKARWCPASTLFSAQRFLTVLLNDALVKLKTGESRVSS